MKRLDNFEKFNLEKLEEKRKIIKGTLRELLKYSLESNIEVFRIFEKKLIFLLKQGDKIRWIQNSLNSETNPIGVKIARDKNLAKKFLEKLNYPIAQSETISNSDELLLVTEKISFPVVVKPAGGGGGEGITTNINNHKLLLDSFKIAKKIDKKVVIEKHIMGDYYRITYVADGSYAATKNIPAFITGNGILSALELIQKENKRNPERYKHGRLKKIGISEKTKRFLAAKGYSLKSIVPKGELLPLCFSGFDGGEYINVTKKIHPYYIKMSRDISIILGLSIVGIDIVAKDISKPLDEDSNGVLIEINATYPDIQFHNKPTLGESINLAPCLINYLFNC